jgi:solute carrier family 25 carnitine/acylcarnitine transporter 20/29
MMEDNSTKYNPTQDIMRGVVAGICGVIVSNPFDKIKTQIQKNGFDSNIIKNINLRTFNAGLSPAICGMALEKGAVFGTYQHTLNYLNQSENYLKANFIAGGTAGFVTSLIITPFEQLKVLMQTKPYQTITYNQPIQNKINYFPSHTISGNIRYYYRGLIPVLTRETPGFAVYFPVFEYLKRYFVEKDNWSISTMFLSGATAGIISWIPIYPQDTIKTIIQSSSEHLRIIDCIRSNQIKNIYRGFWLVPLRVIPLHGTVLTVVELLK